MRFAIDIGDMFFKSARLILRLNLYFAAYIRLKGIRL